MEPHIHHHTSSDPLYKKKETGTPWSSMGHFAPAPKASVPCWTLRGEDEHHSRAGTATTPLPRNHSGVGFTRTTGSDHYHHNEDKKTI